MCFREDLQQPVFAAIDIFEFPELHDESIPFMAFTKALSKLMLVSGVKDFSLQVTRDSCGSPCAGVLLKCYSLLGLNACAKITQQKQAPAEGLRTFASISAALQTLAGRF